jgi:hypothetical protein
MVEGKLGGALCGIAYSTAWGIVLERTASTLFGGVVLPVIDPNILLRSS